MATGNSRVVGRLMPSKIPSAELNERVIVKLDPAQTPFGLGMGTITPAVASQYLLAAEQLGELGPIYEIYERMEKSDARYGGLVRQVKSAVASNRMKVIPAKTKTEGDRLLAEDYAETVREAIATLNTRGVSNVTHNVTRSFCDPHFVGAKLYFLTWELRPYSYGKMIWVPKSIEPVQGKHLFMEVNHSTERYGELKIRVKNNAKGVYVKDLEPSSYLLLEQEAARGRYEALGAARLCMPWYLGIKYVFAWWAQYIQGYAAPLRIGRYVRGTNYETKAELERFLQSLGQNGYALFPNDMEIQLIEANRQGSITTYQDFIRMGHEEYAITLLGQASTVGGKGQAAPYAGQVVANEIRYETLQEVGNYASAGWTSLGAHIIRANYGPDADTRLFPTVAPVIVTPTEMTTKTTTFTSLSNAGVPVPEDYAYEQILGTEPPRDGDMVYVFGQRIQFGVDEMPQSPAEIAQENQEKQTQLKEKEIDTRKVEKGKGERSVVNPQSNPSDRK